MRVHALLGALLVLLVLTPVVRAEEEGEAEQRAAAREAVLIPWSRDARTATLGLSTPATGFLDLWLDFCRSKHANRTKEGARFQGVPHAEWGGEADELVFRAAYVNLLLDEATLLEDDAPALLDALFTAHFAPAVRVGGDDDRWIRLWGVMLATEIAERRADVWTQEAFTNALGRLRDHLLVTLPSTGSFGEGTVRVGSLESERLVWLLGIRASGCERAGEILTQVCRKLGADGSDRCARAAAGILAGCPGPEAEAFVIRELDSGDWERQRTVLSGAGRHATPALLEKVAALVRSADADDRAQMAFVVLQRAAEEDSLVRTEAAATLAALLDTLPEGSERKTMAAMALVHTGNATPGVVTWLRDLVARLEREEAHPGRISFLRRLVERAESQVAEGQTTEDAGE